MKVIESPQALLAKYEEFTLRRVLSTMADVRWCPAPDCGYAVLATNCAKCPQLHCMRPKCNTSFCFHCRDKWHEGMSCEQAALAKQKQSSLLSSGGDADAKSPREQSLKEISDIIMNTSLANRSLSASTTSINSVQCKRNFNHNV